MLHDRQQSNRHPRKFLWQNLVGANDILVIMISNIWFVTEHNRRLGGFFTKSQLTVWCSNAEQNWCGTLPSQGGQTQSRWILRYFPYDIKVPMKIAVGRSHSVMVGYKPTRVKRVLKYSHFGNWLYCRYQEIFKTLVMRGSSRYVLQLSMLQLVLKLYGSKFPSTTKTIWVVLVKNFRKILL